MEPAVDHSLPLTSLASRFGGGLVARLAASKALQSRQASAEPSVAAASREASAGAQHEAPSCPEAGAALPAGPDDEALLLSGLLNAADAAARAGQGLRGRLQQRAALEPAPTVPSRGSSPSDGGAGYSAEFSTLLPEASRGEGSFASLDSSKEASGSDDTRGHQATQPGAPSAGSVAAAEECSRQQREPFQDAEDDAVLTGSPQASTASSSRGTSPSAGLPTAEQEPARLAGLAPGEQELGSPAAQQPPADSFGAPARQLAPAPPPAALRSRLPKPPPKAAIPQQLWQFGAIPQGTASIPSKVPAPERRPAAPAGGVSRPAFYTRAASPPPRPAVAVPATAGAAGWQLQGRAAGSTRESRRERLERLAQPKRSVQPVRHLLSAAPAAATQAGRLGSKPGTAAGSRRASAAAESGSIAAWRPAPAGGGPAGGEAEAADHGSHAVAGAPGGGCSLPRQGPSSRSSGQPGSTRACRWPVALGRPLEGAELGRATGAYSEERFQAHLARLQQALAPHQKRRQQEAEAAADGVDQLVTRVRELGTGVRSAAAVSAAKPPEITAQTVAEPAQLQPLLSPGAEEDEAARPPAKQPSPGGAANSVPTPHSPTESSLCHSPTERLLGCHQRLQQRPLTAPGVGSRSPGPEDTQQRPLTGSPSKVKSLMQVKGEQDAALKRLQEQPRPFRASPLPLSTMEPRYQQQEEQREARRQAAHERRRQHLLEQQQPFGFEERAAERAQRRQLLHGGGPGSPLAAAGSGRPCTPPFHAQLVPVATTEARYALLAAELQLQQRSSRRPATAVSPGSALPASPDRRPATAAACWRSPSRTGRGFRARPADVRDALCSVVTSAQKADGPSRPAVNTVPTEQPGSAASEAPMERAEAARANSLPTTVEEEEGGSSSAAAVQSAEETAARGARYSEQWEAEEASAAGEPCLAAPSLQPDTQAGEGSPGLAQQASAAHLAPAAIGVNLRADGRLNGEADAQSSGRSLAPVAECAEPAVATAAAAGVEASGPEAVSCPVVQRLGARGSSFAGELPSPEPGIAVPVAGGGLGAGVAAELLAAGNTRASPAADSWTNLPAPAVPTAAPGEERRDTPQQHIAARHQQVAAAARREVQAVLARRGLRLDGL